MNNNNSDKYSEKRRLGNVGEDVACIYLEKLGYKIVDRNYLRKYGEIDIVAKKAGITHFVEVKTVSGVTKGYKPEDNMHPWKLKKLSRVIQAYILDKNVGDEWKFDLITVVLNMQTRRARVEMMENIIL